MPSLATLGTVVAVGLVVGVALVLATGTLGGAPVTTTVTTTATTTVNLTIDASSPVTSSTTVSTTSSPVTSSTTVSTTSSSMTTASTTTYTSSATNTSTFSALSAYADSVDGLQLRMSINATQIPSFGPGSVLMVNVSEVNTLNVENNVTKGNAWQVQAALSSCPNTNAQPFGIAVYQGYYTAQNISQGTGLQIFPITPCPMYVRLVTGYSFQPNSDLATILPGSGVTPMAATININGTYNLGATQSGPSFFTPYHTYTVVAVDEWGALAFLYFQVFPGPV